MVLLFLLLYINTIVILTFNHFFGNVVNNMLMNGGEKGLRTGRVARILLCNSYESNYNFITLSPIIIYLLLEVLLDYRESNLFCTFTASSCFRFNFISIFSRFAGDALVFEILFSCLDNFTHDASISVFRFSRRCRSS
jgi:CRISPR/Cas system endoribonuclease Cas6 (RAMP superfamily)